MLPARRAAALLAATTIAVLVTGSPASAESPSPTSSPTPNPIVTLPPVTPTPSPTPTSSPTPKATHSATPSPTPSPTHVRRTSSPRPQLTATQEPTAATVQPTLDVGAPTFSDSPTPKAVKAKPAASRTSSRLARIGWIVIGGAVLLGIGGGAGLYLTRHQA